MMNQVRHVAVIGAGIGGLMSALALSRRNIAVTIFERDEAPPADIDPADSMDWLRRGVPQSLHPHFFMGRMRTLLEEDYPGLVDALLASGVGENNLYDYVHPELTHRVSPSTTDSNLRTLNTRRTTFEMTVRNLVTTLPGVTIRNSAKVDGLCFAENTEVPTVIGIQLGDGIFNADAVIDSSGRFSKLSKALIAHGVTLQDDQRDSGIIYLTRHYKLNDGCEFPSAFGLPGAQFPEFTVGALPADNGHFTVTFQVYREDTALTKALRDPDQFQWACSQVSQTAPWVDPERAHPVSKIHGFGQMDSFWRNTVNDGKPGVLNFFFLGDACLRSNPKYGRGCTWSALAAHELADILATDLDPAERIRRYESNLKEMFHRDWLTMRSIDQSTEKAFSAAMGYHKAGIAERFTQAFQAFVNSAIISEPALFRDLWTGYNGFAEMSDWSRKPANWFRLARAWVTRGYHAELLESQRGRPSHQAMIDPS